MNAAPRPRPPRWLLAFCAASLLCAPASAPVWAQQNLPALGDTASEELDVGVERRLGEQIMRDIRRDPDYLDDPVLLDYLQTLWQPLLAAARARGEISADTDTRFAWEVFLVRDRSVNAFALPGGYVGIHLGLIGMTTARDELASVMAHELAHVTQRHIARSIGQQRRHSMLAMAGMILGVLAAAKSGQPDGANAAIAGSQALMVQGQLNYSRDMEREADRMGFGMLGAAGFAPSGMASMFEKMDHASRLNDNGNFPYLRSHPLTTDRIGEARSRLGTGPLVYPRSERLHAMMQARARVLMDTRVVALRHWQVLPQGTASAAGTSEQLSAAYADALASTLMRDWARADAALARARSLVSAGTASAAASVAGKEGTASPSAPQDAAAERAWALLSAQSQLARGEGLRALALLQPWDNGNRAVMLLVAQAAAETPQAREALERSTERLQTWTTDFPQDASAWLAISRNWQAQGQRLRALRAEAESRLALGDLIGAIDRLRAGQRLARAGDKNGGTVDFIEASVIEVRLRDVEKLRRQFAPERPEG